MLHLARLIYLLFPWASFSAGWCPLGVSPVDLPAYMYLRPRYQEPTQNFRVFVETLACSEFCGSFGCPQLPTMALLYLFWNPKLNCHFLGRNKACNPNRRVFTHFCSGEYGKKTPCFFLSTLLFVSRITYHLKQVPQENWPHGQSLSQQLKMHGMCAQQWAKGSSSSWFSTRHMKNFTTATAYLRANSCICVF